MKTGDKISSKNASWSFKGKVFKNFDKHINKSVPLYNECRELYLYLTDYFLLDKSRIIDLGCSTGTFLKEVHRRHRNNNKKLSFEGYDTVKEMINFSKIKNKKNKVKFFIKDINNVNFLNSCIVSSFYTIQFIPTSKRQNLINKIFEGLNWGGAFFMIEKVRGPDARFQDYITQFYNDYKTSKGFSDDEILSKSRSLKSVLEPFSHKGNMDMLKRAGFKDIMTVFKYGCFEGYLAIK